MNVYLYKFKCTEKSYRTRRLTAIAFSMASLSLRPLFLRKTQLWSLGCRCFRQTLFEHESHFNSISSLTLHFGAQQVPSFFFFRFRAAAFESQSRSICSDTIWSKGLSLSNGTGLSHIGHVGTCLLFFGAKIVLGIIKTEIQSWTLIAKSTTNLWGICVSRSYNDQCKIFRSSLGISLAGSLTDYNLPTYNVFPNPEIPFTEI